MATIGSLVVNLIAETSLFDSGLRKGQTSLKGFVADISKTQHSMMNFAKGVMAAAGVAGLGALVKKTMDSIETTSRLSDRLGMTTEDLISLQYAARQSGMSTEEMNNALETFIRRIGEASTGGGSAAKTLRDLGLSAQELAFKDPAEALKLVADRINQLPNAATKGAAAFDLFGRKSKDMLNLLAGGSTGIEAMRKRAEQLHITFSNLDAAKVTEANDKLKDAQEVLKGVAQTAVIEMAPAISAAADQFIIFVTSIKDMPGKIMSGIETTAMAFSYLANGIVVLVDDVKGLIAIYQILFGKTDEVLKGYETLKEIEKSVDKLPSEKTAAFFADLKTNMQKTREEAEKSIDNNKNNAQSHCRGYQNN